MRRMIMTFSVMTVLSIFGFGQSKSNYKIEPVFSDLRKMSFSVTPEQLGLKIADAKKVFAVFMETGYPEAAFSLRCMGEGTISIYFTNGGGMIGIGEHADVRTAGLKLIEMANSFISKAKVTKSQDIPMNGFTRFYFRTMSGNFMFEDTEDNLGNNRSPFSPLFYQAQKVITKAREVDESKNK